MASRVLIEESDKQIYKKFLEVAKNYVKR